jgi:hypothetical protein
MAARRAGRASDMLQIDAARGIHRVQDDNTNWYIVDGL